MKYLTLILLLAITLTACGQPARDKAAAQKEAEANAVLDKIPHPPTSLDVVIMEDRNGKWAIVEFANRGNCQWLRTPLVNNGYGKQSYFQYQHMPDCPNPIHKNK